MSVMNFIYFLLFSYVTLTSDVKVLELTAEFFENYTTKSDGITVVMFYAPWCPHCTDAKPELFKAAAKMAKINSKNVFALLNCEDAKNADICQQQNIEGYPTIKAFGPNKQIHIFNGSPTENDLLKFIENPAQFSETSNLPETGDSNSDSDKVADVPFNHTKYLNKKTFNETLIKTQHALVFFYAPWCPHCHDSKPGIDKASEKLKSKNHEIFAVNCEDKENKALCTEQEIEGFPTIKYYQKGEFFAEYDDELSTDSYLQYLSKPPKEKVKSPPHKENAESENKPEEKMEFVKYLTGKDFQDQIKIPNHHTMVMYYAPWCSHCQAAKGPYNSGAKTITERNPNHILAAINCDDKSNEKLCESEGVTGFPTFIHYFKGKKLKQYEETPIDTEKLIKYFSKYTKDEL